MTSKMSVLRWIGVIPASIVGMYVCYLFSMLAGYLNFGWGVTINGETINIVGAIVSILANGFAGYGFVYCGAYVAPRYKGVTALLLMIVLVIGVILFQFHKGTIKTGIGFNLPSVARISIP